MSKMGKKIDRKSNSDLVLQDYSEDEFDKEEEITRPRKGNDSNHAKSSVQDVLKDPNFSIKHASLPIKAKNEDMTFTLGSSDLLGETAPRRNRREKQWEISKDEFSGFDLSNMLGLDNSHGDKEKKADAHASKPNGSENGRSAITKSSQIQEPLKSDAMYQDDDIPSYVKTFSNQENGRRGRRGGGNTQTEITNDKAAPKADLANSIKRDTDISLLDLLDKVISSKPANTQSEQNNSSKPHILNIIDTTHSPSKRGMEATDSLSSVALISDTDEEEVPIRPGKDIDGKSKQPKSKDTTPNLKSKHTASNHADDQLKKLTENLQIVTKNFEADLKLEKAQKESLVSENTLLLNKLESITKDHQLEMQNLKSSHQQEISAMLSTTEATKKLNGLVAQVENTTIMVTNLQSQLDVTNDESLRAREKAVEIKEVHLSRMQEELRNESKSLQEERARVEAYLLELQEGIKTAAIKESEALQTIDLEKTRLRVESEKFEREKSAWKFDFNQQKSTFMMDVENWNLQKEALQQEINKEKKELATIKASLFANEKYTIVRDQEFEQRMQAERQQFDIEYKMFESERNDLLQKLKILHRDEAFIKTEKLKLEERQREVATMSKVFEKDEKDLENKYVSISNMRDEAVRERNRTETLHQEIQALKKELEETQISCQREMLNLKETKSDYVRQRVEKARQFQVGSIPNTTEEPMPISNTPAELQYATSAPKSRSAFRIDPLDERYRFKEPKATVWTIEEEALATQLQKALDRQMRRGKNRDADHTIAKQERMLVKIR